MLALVTNGGPHPPETLALGTAQVICPIDPELPKTDGARHLQALSLQAAIAKALAPHHAEVQNGQRNLIKMNGILVSTIELGVDEGRVTESIKAVQQAALGTPWQEHFQKPEVVNMIAEELHRHFRTNQQIERQWHADRSAPGYGSGGGSYLKKED